MTWLSIGVLFWIVAHLFPCWGPTLRQSMIDKLGKGPYMGLFALDIVIALVLIVVGWRSTIPEVVYTPPAWGYDAALPLMAISVFLFGAAQRKSAVKRVLRHPQQHAGEAQHHRIGPGETADLSGRC